MSSTYVEKPLGQLNPADTNAASIYSPSDNMVTIIRSIRVCNTTAGALSFRIFCDQDGSTYDTTTALYYDESIAANTTKEITADFIVMDDSAGNLAVRSSSANGLNFSVYGVEIGGVVGLGLYRTFWVDAGAMVPRTTNGAASATEEYATNDIMSDHFLFDSTTEEAVQFRVSMPDEWDLGTIKVKVYWDAATGGSGDVVWGVKGGAISNNDAIDTALGTEQTVTDTVLAVGDLHVATTPAITVGGTPALEDAVWIQVARKAGDAADTMNSHDAKLLGVMVQYKELTTAPTVW